MFLDSIRERQEEEERQRKERDGEEVKNFKEYVRLSNIFSNNLTPTYRAVAARTSAINQPLQTTSAQRSGPVATKSSTVRKDSKKVLKGVVVKRKRKPTGSPSASDTKSKSAAEPDDAPDNAPLDPKRRKIDSS